MPAATEDSKQEQFLSTPQSGNLFSIDKDGDVILAVECYDSGEVAQFRVSTKVLGLASPVFAKLFGRDFQEGQVITNQECPCILLEDDDPRAVRVILSILHYESVDQLPTVDAEGLAALAVHCDKYDCLNALRAWISHWFMRMETITRTPEELSFLLVAAYFFDDEKQFEGVSRRVLRELTPEGTSTWKENQLLSLLPSGVSSEIERHIKRLQRMLHSELESVDALLRENKVCHAMQCLLCMTCGRTPPIGAKKCHPCRNVDLYQKHCTYEVRVAEYFAILTREALWPSIITFETCSVSDLEQRFAFAKDDLKHVCSAGSRCPLQREIEGLLGRVCFIDTGIKGGAASSEVGTCQCT